MNVHAEADALVDETTAAKVTMELMMRMASIVDEAYPMINKAICPRTSLFTKRRGDRAAARRLRHRQAAGMKREA